MKSDLRRKLRFVCLFFCCYFLDFFLDLKYCNSRPLTSHIKLREISPLTVGSGVRDSTSCVLVPQTVGAKSVRLRHGLQNLLTA